MPYTSAFVAAEVAFVHAGVKVYHVYRDDDMEQGPRPWDFGLREETGDGEGFDVRELANWSEPAHPPYLLGDDDTPENRHAWERYHTQCVEARHAERIIREAVDAGTVAEPCGCRVAPGGPMVPCEDHHGEG